MKANFFFTLALCLLVGLVAAWDSEDHEIFRLRDEVLAAEGEDVSFYDLLKIKSSASLDDITKAYRKISRTAHPDKARQQFIASYALGPKGKKGGKKPGVHVSKGPTEREIQAFVKKATEKFARLRVVAELLKGPQRDRYDYFLKNGFPKWRGTGYYYNRFRPGLGSVLFGLFIMFGGAAHYGALYVGWTRQRDFVDRYIRHARKMAWGDELGIQGLLGEDTAPGVASGYDTPPTDDPSQAGNRRQKRLQEKEARKKAAKAAKNSGFSTPVETEVAPPSAPRGAKKRVVAENGKVLIVDASGNVFLEEEDDEGEIHEYLLDINEIPKPTIYDTVLFRFPGWAYNITIGKVFGKAEEQYDDSDADTNGTARATSAKRPRNNGNIKKRRAKAQARAMQNQSQGQDEITWD